MENVARSWGWVLFFGLLTLIIGILVVVWPEGTLRVLTVLFGLELILVGIFRLVRSFASGEQHRVWSVILGIAAIGDSGQARRQQTRYLCRCVT